MNSKDFQKWTLTKDRTEEQYAQVAERLTYDPRAQHLLHAILGLSGEAGELVDAFKKHIFYGKDLDIDNVKEECGDVLYYMAVALEAIGSSFEEVMEGNRQKLEKRYPTGFTEQLAEERRDKAKHPAIGAPYAADSKQPDDAYALIDLIYNKIKDYR